MLRFIFIYFSVRLLSQILSITFCSILIRQKEPAFPFFMLSAKQGNLRVPFLQRLWNDLDWGLDPGPPALDASILPLDYRGGGA